MSVWPARVCSVALVLAAAGPPPAADARASSAPQGAVTPAELGAAIDDLGRLDYHTRMTAGRTVRRAPAAMAVRALIDAATSHVDGYVRYRALVLLSGFNDPRARDVMEASLGDRNDRLRAVAYAYFEHHPDRTIVPLLVAALDKETSEFVRPALTRALAAYGNEPAARAALLPLVERGRDFFRSAVIEALGDDKAAWAVDAVDRVARLDGPLRTVAALALGRIGDRRSLATLAGLQREVSEAEQPEVAAAICLLGVNCGSHVDFVVRTLRFGIEHPGYQELVRASAHALGEIAVADHPDVASTLFDLGVPARDPARAPIALAAGTIAIRNTPLVLKVLEPRADLDGAVLLLRDAFDMLEEDYEEERFYATVRRAYWQAPEGSMTRQVTEALIQRLEF